MVPYWIDPLRDARWAAFVQKHPRASVFHTPGWLQALKHTYSYEPVVLTTSPPGTELRNGLVLCRIDSWLTGRRLVSLPFSDHCECLVDDEGEVEDLLHFLRREQEGNDWRYIEIRLLTSRPNGASFFARSADFYWHKINLNHRLDELFGSFHKDCVQRKIRRAEREALTYERGRSESVLRKFYGLFVQTRRRHQLPPPPLAWFRNLINCLGEMLTIHVAARNGFPVASILTLSFRKVIVYKYGCSDARYHKLGGMALLFWKTIEEAKKNGAQEFDLGRSEPGQSGLIAFKEHWGAQRSPLTYWRDTWQRSVSAPTWKLQMAKRLFSSLPETMLTATGKVLYRHFG